MKIKKFNESVFNSMVEQRIDDCVRMIGDSFLLDVKDNDSAKRDLIEFLKKHYIKRNQDNDVPFDGEFDF
jgi:hypothetical protein